MAATVLPQRKSDDPSLPPSPPQQKLVISPVPEKSIMMVKKPIARQQSITRGTASSMAKAVRPPPTTIVPPTNTTTIISPPLPSDPNNIQQRKLQARTRKQSLHSMDTNRLLVTGSAMGNAVLSQRRSSWSPFTPNTTVERKTPFPTSPEKKQQSDELLSLPLDQTTSPLVKKAIATIQQQHEPSINKRENSSGTTSSSTSHSSSSVSTTRVHSSLSTNNKKEDILATPPNDNTKTSGFFKFNDDALPHAASLENNQQKQKNNNIPLETPPPDDDEEVLSIRSSTCSDQQKHNHHHHHNHQEDDSDLPGYMRRPICAACNRKVKVTSSSESITIPRSSTSATTANNSRRSSIISSSATTHSSTSSSTRKKEENNNIKILTHDERSVARSYSPTSPIPTRKTPHHPIGERRRSSTLQELARVEPQSTVVEEEEEEGTLSLHHPNSSMHQSSSDEEEEENNSDKWNQLLSQQQKLLEFMNKDPSTMMTLSSIKFNKKDETVILETQVELLKRFETALLLMTSNQLSPPSTAPVSQPTHTLVDIQSQQQLLPITSWQTQVEFGITKFKWNLSQWFGTLVGTANIEEQDFDILGYTKNVVISGVCVTTEPGLLPKNLLKYHRLHQDNSGVICYKYIIHLTRESRLSSFALTQTWDKDDDVHQCTFSIRENTRTKHCSTQFGVFNRRHHCRSCGHIYCQTHCSNRLPLFITNGEERGEWSRVCDSCFYARIEPQFIARS